MDQSFSESDVSLSPSHILERLQVLRQLQLLQRGKLQKQQLQYNETTETSSSITEIVSQFSNSTSYNTFRSLLLSPQDSSTDATPRTNTSNTSEKVKAKDLIDGVSVLNLSQESEFIVNSPLSTKSRVSASSRAETSGKSILASTDNEKTTKKQISLDEMPILAPKQDFETLVQEKLKNEKNPNNKSPKKVEELGAQSKKPFLRRGEGMARFGLRKNDLVIQNIKTLPWRQRNSHPKMCSIPSKKQDEPSKSNDKVEIQILVTEPKSKSSPNKNIQTSTNLLNMREQPKKSVEIQQEKVNKETAVEFSNCEMHNSNCMEPPKVQFSKGKHPLIANKGKTWAAVLTKEQDDFLRQLKQSDYYKNFVSPAKSINSDISCDESVFKMRQEREIAEQNMFELLENKVTNESFSLNNSFIRKFLKRRMEVSGESTPLIMQKCLEKNPQLLHIFPDMTHKKRNENSFSDAETCISDYTECSDTCSSASTCCSCKTVETNNNASLCQNTIQNENVKKKDPKQKGEVSKPKRKEVEKIEKCTKSQGDTVTETDMMKANMAEMNAKLVATSELLKDRLQELEDEIETFRKENASLAKMREEVDLERQKFYEDKSAFEQKFNEEKILSEYYLAEEKEQLNKQKQMYERYVREMRGRLNKKEKDDVLNLKKEISDLKEEIRIKDAKSTSTIARLRNQLKVIEKEKSNLQTEVEKLKKENRRMQHSNDITRRLTNVKYLEEINKKLRNMTKEPKSEIELDKDVKYKAYEIERQSRSRRVQPPAGIPRQRAKSVPNLNVTSRYAKYFSQRDVVSQMERNKTLNVDHLDKYPFENDNEIEPLDDTESVQDKADSENEDNLIEKIYMERFQTTSPPSNRSSLSNNERQGFRNNPDGFFIQKSNSRGSNSPDQRSISPCNIPINMANTKRSKSPVSILSNRSGHNSPSNMNHLEEVNNTHHRKSPISILSNRSSSSHRLPTVINQDTFRDKLMSVSPEPSSSKSSVSKTNLNPTEIKKPDGSKELKFPNGNVKHISADGKYTKFVYYNGDVKENFYNEGRIKYYYAEAKTYHTTHADGLEVLEFPE